MHELIAYHACSDCGSDWEIVSQRIPFKSKNTRTQWLGVGFYFWPDSPYYAHKWGKGPYKGRYIVSKVTLTFPYNEMFDLVGNVEHGLKFKNEYMKLAEIWLRELENTRKSSVKLAKIKKTLCVSDIFWLLRSASLKNPSLFPYKLVKAGDFQFASDRIKFVESRQEYMQVSQRIQLVVYPEAKKYIGSPELFFRTEKGKSNEHKQL